MILTFVVLSIALVKRFAIVRKITHIKRKNEQCYSQIGNVQKVYLLPVRYIFSSVTTIERTCRGKGVCPAVVKLDPKCLLFSRKPQKLAAIGYIYPRLPCTILMKRIIIM